MWEWDTNLRKRIYAKACRSGFSFSMVKSQTKLLASSTRTGEYMNRDEQLHCLIETSIRTHDNSSAMEATATATPRAQEEQVNKASPAKVTTDEVTLRKLELSDVDAMMVWMSDPQVAAVCRWEPYESTDRLLAFIRDTVLPHPWFRAICLESRPVGAVSVTPTGEPCRAELGYVLAPAHWGRGVATAAVKRALATVFGEVRGLERVEAFVDVSNPASQRVLEKAGFTREAVLRKYSANKGKVRDMVIFSFIDTDPVPE